MFFLSYEIRANPACPSLKKRIGFSIKTMPKSTSYHLNVNQNKLNHLSKQTTSRRKNQKILGLTSRKHSIILNMAGQSFQIGGNLFCTRVVSVNIAIKILKLDVYVLGKYQKGSCQYSSIIDHEHEHVAIYHSGIAALKREFEEKLWNIIRNLPPGIGQTPEISSQTAFRNLKRSISRLQAPIERMMEVRDREIDTPSSYRNLIKKCTGW